MVKSLPEEPNLTITLTVGGRQRNLDRPKSEPLEKPLARLQKAAAPQPDKRKKQKQNSTPAVAESEPAAPFIGVHDGPTSDHPILDPISTSNEDAWLHGRLLRVGDASYLIELNPPSIERLTTHGLAFVGIPVVPSVALHFAELEGCRWQWWRRSPEAAVRSSEDGWQPIPGATQRGYTPTESDVGCMLRVACTPTRHSEGAFGDSNGSLHCGEPAVVETGPVQRPPQPGAAAGRAHLTPSYLDPPGLRVMTYNILADQYASTDSAKNVLFASCPSQ